MRESDPANPCRGAAMYISLKTWSKSLKCARLQLFIEGILLREFP